MQDDPLNAEIAAFAVGGPENLIHVNFAGKDINYNMFSLPTLEILTVKAISADGLAAIREILNGFQLRVQRPELSAWGEVVEEPGTFKFFVGWNSAEVSIIFIRYLSHQNRRNTWSMPRNLRRVR